MMRNIWAFMMVAVLFWNCEAQAGIKINSGPWLFELQTNNAIVPFIVEFEWKGKVLTGYIVNGKEKIPLRDIVIKKDQITIPVQNYEITMNLTMNSPKNMNGFLIRHNKNPVQQSIINAQYGIAHRFVVEKGLPKNDFTGKYSVLIMDEEGQKSPGVLVLDQKGVDLYGSLLTTTGDYRYFQGHVYGDDFTVASFDGMFNYIIKGTIKKGMFEGTLLSNYKLKLSGKFDANAALPDAYKQTQIDKLEFSFPDLKGKIYTLDNKEFNNKPVIVQFFGSWCPNCMDEMNYLIPWYAKNKKRGIEIVALAFERSLEPSLAKMQVAKVQKMKKIPYVVLLAGSTAEDKPMEKIKNLKHFISFPTMIFLNRKHEVVKVHAGFTGPGTGEFYEAWIKEFNDTVNTLVKK